MGKKPSTQIFTMQERVRVRELQFGKMNVMRTDGGGGGGCPTVWMYLKVALENG